MTTADRLHSSPLEDAPAWGGLTVPAWFVFSTHPNAEFLAEARLEKEGFEVFMPAAAVKQTSQGRSVEIRRPVFSGYGFVRLLIDCVADPTERWVKARYVEGVKALLPAHLAKPMPVPEGCVSDIRARIDAGEFSVSEIEKVLRRYVPGQQVQVVEGPLARGSELVTGRVISRRGDLVRLMLCCIGRETEVILRAKHLAPAD